METKEDLTKQMQEMKEKLAKMKEAHKKEVEAQKAESRKFLTEAEQIYANLCKKWDLPTVQRMGSRIMRMAYESQKAEVPAKKGK